MKVALVTHETFFPVKGGGTIRVLEIARAFRRKGHKVKIYAPYGHTYNGETEVTTGIEYRGICNIERFKTKNKETAYIRFILKTSLILLFEKYDFLFSHIAVAGASAVPSRILKKCPSHIDLDDIISGLSSMVIVKNVLPLFESFIPLFFDSVSCMSKALAKNVLTRRSDNVHIVPHGADLKLFKPAEKNVGEKGHFVFSGGMEAHDGIDLILNAVNLLKEKYPFIRVTIIGDGSKLEDSITLCGNLGLKENINFTGWLNHEEVPSFHRRACAGLICDKKAPATEVALVVRGVEYMASGIPVIACDNEGNKELVTEGENGIFFKGGDHISLSRKMEWIISNPEEAQNMGNNGRKYAEEHFSWARNASRIVEICESTYSTYETR